MAKAADDASVVLASLKVLYDLGANLDLQSGDVLAAMKEVGIGGFTSADEPYLAMAATMLRLLLRHAEADPGSMYDAAMADIAELGRDIEDDHFSDIASHYEHGEDPY